MNDFLEVNGELIEKSEGLALVRMFLNDAEEFAGQFYEMNRSAKFRANWPNQDVFVKCQWKNFVEAARLLYAQRLGNPNTPAHEARKMHLAIVLYTMAENSGVEQFGGTQILPDTQQFEGDKFENKKIVENWGKQSNTFKELLMGSTRYH